MWETMPRSPPIPHPLRIHTQICVNRFRPFNSLRFKMARPPRVFFLARKPHLRFRFMLDGWYVRLISKMARSRKLFRRTSPEPQISPIVLVRASGASPPGHAGESSNIPCAILRTKALQLDAASCPVAIVAPLAFATPSLYHPLISGWACGCGSPQAAQEPNGACICAVPTAPDAAELLWKFRLPIGALFQS